MANTNNGNHSAWDTVDANGVKAGKALVNAIHFVSGATAGLTTLQSDGTTWWSSTIAADSYVSLHWTKPQVVQNLTLSVVGTNVVAYVHWA